MKFEFVPYGSSLYKQAVSVRIEQFFKKMKNADVLIEDAVEQRSDHLICRIDDTVVGTARLTDGVISQMTVRTSYQSKGIGAQLLHHLVTVCIDKKVMNITLSARKTTIGFYEKNKFKTIGKQYPSKKTGIVHQQMERKLIV